MLSLQVMGARLCSDTTDYARAGAVFLHRKAARDWLQSGESFVFSNMIQVMYWGLSSSSMASGHYASLRQLQQSR